MLNIKEIARIIWNIRREEEDRSDKEIEDLRPTHSVFREAEALIAELAKQNEPVYAFRRKGLDDFCTCDKQRFDELSQKPALFEVRVFYTLPPTAEQIANETAWQPIETAPKDGTFILCFVDAYMKPMVLFWDSLYWREPANMLGLKKQPTHWMPLPKAPNYVSS